MQKLWYFHFRRKPDHKQAKKGGGTTLKSDPPDAENCVVRRDFF